MEINKFICGDCGGKLVIKGYFDFFFEYTDCGLVNNAVKVDEK